MSDSRQDSPASEAEIYSNMSTEELENLISYAFYEDNVDFETLDKMMEVYNKRDGVPELDIPAAWEEFQKYYSGTEETFPIKDADNTTQTKRSVKRGRPNRLKRLKYFGYTAAAVVVSAVVFFRSTALGVSIWQSFAQWTKDVFGYASNEVLPNIELASLHEELANHDITAKLAPTWLPDGFTLLDLAVHPTPQQIVFHAYYENGDRELVIQIIELLIPTRGDYEKDDERISIYERNGIEHHIMTNNGKINAVWVFENYECGITGDVTEDEVKTIINSIYER